MRFLSSVLMLITFFVSPSLWANVEPWLNWEISRNDLQSNPSGFHPLPENQELKKYQVNEIYELKVSSEHVKSALPNAPLQQNKIISFYIHPEALELFPNLITQGQLRKIKVRPTSSPRSFYIGDNKMVKVSLPQKINGAIRTIYPLQMSRALSISQMLNEIPLKEKQESHFNFLPETQAIYDGTPDSPFGFILREIPEQIVTSNKTLVPLFAFLSQKDGYSGKIQKSLLEVSALKKGKTPTELLNESVIPSILKSFTLAAKYGIILEGHQQNLLLELDMDNHFTGEVYYRDLDGARVDFDLRQRNNLSSEKYLNLPDSGWIFDLEKLTQMNKLTKAIENRPLWWTQVMEFTLQRYYIGSSFYLMKKYFQQEHQEFHIEQKIESFMKSLDQLNTYATCKGLFI